MNVILPLCFIAIFIVIIYKHGFFKNSGLSFQILIGLFLLKIVAACALHFLYSFYYTERLEADIFKYFDDALILFKSCKDSPVLFFKLFFSIDIHNPALTPYYDALNFWERKIDYGIFNDNRTIIRINALLMFVSWGNIFVHHIIASFVSLIAFLLIFKVFTYYFQQHTTLFIISIFLIPSSLFWASALLKEMVVMLGLGLLLYGIHSYTITSYRKYIIIIGLGILVMSTIKIYVIVACIPAILSFIISHTFQHMSSWKIYISIYTLSIVSVIINHYVHIVPFLETIASKRNDFIMDSAYYAHARSYIEIGMLKSTLSAFIYETPKALLRAFQLPTITHIQSPIEILPAIENFVGLLLVICMIFWFKKPNKKQQNIIWFSVFFSIGLLWFVGISTPVVGAIVRYKMPMLPFLYTSLALCIDWKACKNVFVRKDIYGSSII